MKRYILFLILFLCAGTLRAANVQFIDGLAIDSSTGAVTFEVGCETASASNLGVLAPHDSYFDMTAGTLTIKAGIVLPATATYASNAGLLDGFDSSYFISATSASVTYLFNSSATATYLSQTNAAALYITLSSASATYLQDSSATATYLSIDNAGDIYLTQSSATATYLQGSSATATYIQGVIAGTNLNGGGSSGEVTLNLDDPISISSGTITDFYASTVTADYVQSTATYASDSNLLDGFNSDYFISASSASVTYLFNSSATATYLTLSSAAATYLMPDGDGSGLSGIQDIYWNHEATTTVKMNGETLDGNIIDCNQIESTGTISVFPSGQTADYFNWTVAGGNIHTEVIGGAVYYIDSTAQSILYLETTNNQGFIIMKETSGGITTVSFGNYLGDAFFQAINGDIGFWDNAAKRMTIERGGNVGISKVNPAYLLDMEASGGGYYDTADHDWHTGSSLESMKTNISMSALSAIDSMNALPIKTFQYKDVKEIMGTVDDMPGEMTEMVIGHEFVNPKVDKPYSLGYIAEDIPQPLIDAGVFTEDGNMSTKGAFSFLLKLCQEQQARIEALEKP